LSKTNLGEGARRALPLLLWLPLLAAVALLLSGCAAQSSQPSGQEPRQSAEDQTGGSGDGEQASRSELGHPALGDAGAPVVMVEYADFQ
jgi:protein-disulfide isomerase